MSNERKTSPWMWVGVGCAVALVLIVCVVVGVCYLGYRWTQRVGEEMKDPVAREAKVKSVLGADTMPSGYYPLVGLSVPFVMDMAVLDLTDYIRWPR